MKISHFIFVAFLAITDVAFAQTSNTPYQYIPKYDPPKSPNASSFEHYLSIPSNYQTGQINPVIPLLSFTVDNLTVPVTLNYSNTGLKVSDVASWAGLGWNLNVGGIITRTVKGIPDDGTYGLFDPYTASQQQLLLNGQLTGKARFDYFQLISKQLVDMEHDIFSYDVLGISGKFYINNVGQCVQFPNSTNKIEFTKDQYQHISAFTITDLKGNKYLFNLKEESNIVANTNNITGSVDYYYNTLKGATWYLTKILTQHNQEIDFSYNHYQYYQTEKTESQLIPSLSNGGNNCGDPPSTPSSTQFDLQKSYITTLVDVEQLSQITWKNGVITFNPGPNRSDLQQINAAAYSGTATTANIPSLGSISMAQTISSAYPSQIQNISFTYVQSPRLFLRKIDFNNSLGGANHHYEFSYNGVDYVNPSIFSWPSYDVSQSSYNAQDYWGYYNGVLNNNGMIPFDAFSTAPPIYHDSSMNPLPYYPPVTGVNLAQEQGLNNRVPNPTYASYGMLNKIKYPTGGKTIFSYEGNTVQKNRVPTTTPESLTLINTLPQGVNDSGNPVVTLGGLRIKQMDFYNDTTSLNPVLQTHLLYDQTSFSCAFIPFFYTYVERIKYDNIANTTSQGPGCYVCSNAYQYTLNSSGTITDARPLIQYHNVIEYNGTANKAGQVYHSYTPSGEGNESYFQAPYPTPFSYNWQNNETQTSNQLSNGTNIKVKSHTDDGTLMPVDYDFKVTLIRNDGCATTDASPIHYTNSVEPNSDGIADTVVTGIYRWAKVAITSQNYLPITTEEITYDSNGQQIQVLQNYNYDLNQNTPLFPSSTSSTDSKGDATKKLFSYPQNYF